MALSTFLRHIAQVLHIPPTLNRMLSVGLRCYRLASGQYLGSTCQCGNTLLNCQLSPNCTENFEADILKLCWWPTYLQSLGQNMFLHLFVPLAKNRTEGEPINRYPIAANSLRVIPSKLEFFCWSKPISITTARTPGRLPKTLLVSYVSLVSSAKYLALSISDWLLSSPTKTQTEGESIPYRSKFPAQNAFKIGVVKRNTLFLG